MAIRVLSPDMPVYLLIGDIGEGIKVHGVYRTLEGARLAASKLMAKSPVDWPEKWCSNGPDRWTRGVDWLAIEAKNLEE